MALITTSGIGVTQFSGKLGNEVFSRNTSGNYVKAYAAPTDPGTSFQTSVRAYMTASVALWETLSLSEQETWHQAAKSGIWKNKNRLGHMIKQSGRSLFLHMNVTVAHFSRTITEPPAPRSIVVPFLTDVQYVNPGPPQRFYLYFSESSITSETVTQVWATAPLSIGVTRPKKSAFRRFTFRGSGTFASPFDVRANYITRFGTPASGARIFFRTTQLDLLTALQYQSGQGSIDT